MRPIVEKLFEEGYLIDFVDIDSDPDKAKEFSVSSVPTLVLVENGKEIKRWVGVVTDSEIKQTFKKRPDYKIW